MLQRGLACVAAAVMACAIGAALLQLAILVLGLSSPVAITVICLAVVIGLNSLRRRVRSAARNRFSPRNPGGIHR